MTENVATSGTGEAIRELSALLGADRVLADEERLRPYSHDAWPVSVVNQRLGRHPYPPDVAVLVTSERDVSAVLTVARRHGVPVTTRGLGSSVTGQPLPTRGGIVLDTSQLTSTPELDTINHVVDVAAGTRGSELESWLNERGYTLNHFPQSLPRSSVGGWVATRASGQFSTRFGSIEDLVVGFRVVLADGSAVDVGSRPRSATGPDLRPLFIGSEGTLGVVVAVRLKVFRQHAHTRAMAYRLPDVRSGIDTVREMVQAQLRPALVRFYDAQEAAHLDPAATIDAPVLFLAHEGPIAEAEADVCASLVTAHGGAAIGPDLVERWFARRYDFSAIENVLARHGGYAETIEVAHMWSALGDLYHALLDVLGALADRVFGHLSHAYDQGASFYLILSGTADTDAEALARLETVWDVAMKTTLALGGEITHHHGVGLARREYVAESLGSQHALLRRLKQALDPENLLNPGKLGFG